MMGLAWGFVAPWLGPVVMWLAPRLARWRASAGSIGNGLSPAAGFLLLVGAVAIAALMVHARRETLRSEGEARCSEAVASITIDQLHAERDRADRAERAANAARDDARMEGEGFVTRLTELERELAARPRKSVCYPAALARRLNQL